MFVRKFFLTIFKPNLLESERHKWIKKNIKLLQEDGSILDIGAGEQIFKDFCKHLRYTSQDLCEYDGTGKEGLQTGKWDTSNIDIISDAISIPVESNSFDNILCTEVLEHTAHPIKVLEEIYRILKPEGYAIITVPSMSMTHFAPYFYYSGFSKYFFKYHSNEIGFKIKEIKNIGGAFDLIFSVATGIRPAIKNQKGLKRIILISTTYFILFLTGILRITVGKLIAQDTVSISTLVLLRKPNKKEIL